MKEEVQTNINDFLSNSVMKLKNLKFARWPFFIFYFLFNCLRYKRNTTYGINF